MGGLGAAPTVSVGDRQRIVRLDVKRVATLARAALPLCLEKPGEAEPVLTGLDEVAVVLVSDRTIARVHRQFMDIAGATDVITFAHGEIVVSVTTAEREAGERGEPTEREVLRYIVHGLLHLNGHEDAQAEEAAAMWQVQEAVVGRVWPEG